MIANVQVFLGSFDHPKMAARARDLAVVAMCKPGKTELNFPGEYEQEIAYVMRTVKERKLSGPKLKVRLPNRTLRVSPFLSGVLAPPRSPYGAVHHRALCVWRCLHMRTARSDGLM
jgi:hypothetical protein